MNLNSGLKGNRIAVHGYGEYMLHLMSGASDAAWAKWLRAPFEHAAERGDIPLTTALMMAGAKGDAFILAVCRGHHTLVRNMLEMGASTSGKDEQGYTPLHIAAMNKQGRMVRTLLIEGADVNEPDQHGRSPLHLACMSGDPASVQALLAAGSDANHRGGMNGSAPLDFAVRFGHIEASKVLLEKGADINGRGRHGRTALHEAVMADQPAAIRFLAQQPGIDVHCEDEDRIAPLHVAASEGRLRAVEALVDSGVDVELRTSRALQIHHGSRSRDCSALDFAASRGHLDVVKALVQRGADVRAVSNSDALTSLHHAAVSNRVDVIEFLIRAGAAVDGPTPYWRPLHLAVEGNHPEAILALARHGASLHDSHGVGLTPLAQAALQTNIAALNALLAAGADPNVTDGTNPALLTAARSSNPGSEAVVRILAEQGADVNAIWNHQEQALHGAVIGGTVGIVDLLIAHGADVDGHNGYLSPLHVACSSTHCSACFVKVSSLLGYGADIHLQDSGGNTALHMAAANRSAEIVDLLLRAGADETVRNNDFHTPAERVRSTHTDSASDEEILDPILRLLDGAPADRAWRRRGFLVLCRAFPGKARLESTLRTRVELPRASKRGAAARWGGGRRSGGDVLAVTTQNGGLNNLLARLSRVEEDGIFRMIVSLL